VAVPAGWPSDELTEGHVIVSPATDVEGAKERLKEYERFDGRFGRKKSQGQREPAKGRVPELRLGIPLRSPGDRERRSLAVSGR
jgi:hypothetical protein